MTDSPWPTSKMSEPERAAYISGLSHRKRKDPPVHSSETSEEWRVRNLRGLDELVIRANNADEVATLLEELGEDNTVVVREVTRMTTDVYEYTPAEFLGEDLDGPR